jgi:hypothetical protein
VLCVLIVLVLPANRVDQLYDIVAHLFVGVLKFF